MFLTTALKAHQLRSSMRNFPAHLLATVLMGTMLSFMEAMSP